jgi:hypothetical protein
MKPASRKKTRKSRSSSGNPVTQKKDTSFFQPQEGGEHNFFQPQAKNNSQFPQEVQAKMESLMGEDFSGVSIHENSAEATGMHAKAFTQGENIHFAPGQYNPETHSGQELIGHELAHVRQQRRGRVGASLQLKGRNVNTDSSLEAEADAMGRKAAGASAGQGSAALGLRRSMSGKAASGVAQMSQDTDAQIIHGPYGDFKTDPGKYKRVFDYGVEIDLQFDPNEKVNATKIGLVQMVKERGNGKIPLFTPTIAARTTADGESIDSKDPNNNPVYGAPNLRRGAGLEETNAGPGPGNNYSLGFRKKDNSGNWVEKNASLYDRPTMDGHVGTSYQIFETTALALEGAQKGMYYGSVRWGWIAGGTTFVKLHLDLTSISNLPTDDFFEAAQKWNDGKERGTIVTKGDPTKLYTGAFTESGDTIPKNTKVLMGTQTFGDGGITYNRVSYLAGSKYGLAKTSDLKDLGKGETVNLPIPRRRR